MIDHDVCSPVAEPGPLADDRIVGHRWASLVLGAALVAMSLVAGLIYTFSVAVMPNLAGADDATFVVTMQRFNENPVFVVSFTVALVLITVAAVLQRGRGADGVARWTVAALVLYGLVVAVTAGLHIPLNNEIDRAGDPDRIADLAHVRDQFEGPWVAGNIVRTLLATAAVAALTRALALHGRSPADPQAATAATGRSWPPPSPAAEPPPIRPAQDGEGGSGSGGR